MRSVNHRACRRATQAGAVLRWYHAVTKSVDNPLLGR